MRKKAYRKRGKSRVLSGVSASEAKFIARAAARDAVRAAPRPRRRRAVARRAAYAQPRRRARSGYSKIKAARRRANSRGWTIGLTAVAGLAGVAALNRNGLTQSLDTQQYTGISVYGWLGALGFVLSRYLLVSPAAKDIGYTVSSVLIAYEVQRQIETSFVDFSSVFGTAPALPAASEQALPAPTPAAQVEAAGKKAKEGIYESVGDFFLNMLKKDDRPAV